MLWYDDNRLPVHFVGLGYLLNKAPSHRQGFAQRINDTKITPRLLEGVLVPC